MAMMDLNGLLSVCVFIVFFLYPSSGSVSDLGIGGSGGFGQGLVGVGKTLVVISVIVVAREIAVIGWLATDLDSIG